MSIEGQTTGGRGLICEMISFRESFDCRFDR